MHPKDAKALLRQSIRERLAGQTEPQRHAESRSLCKRILESLPPGPLTICAYFPLKDEADLRPLLEELLMRGDKLFLPRFENGIVFRRLETREELRPGQWKIPEPPPDAELLDPAMLDIALIPARAYDRTGHRLGRGNGGYDLWITQQRAKNPRTRFWGVALECQLVDAVPMEPHDATVDALVTARGIVTPTVEPFGRLRAGPLGLPIPKAEQKRRGA